MPTIKQKDVFPATDVPWSQGVKVYNNSGSSIATNDIVYASGRRGLHMEVTAADSDAQVSALGSMFVARHQIPNGEYGHVLPWKVEADVDTSAASVAGQAVYLSGTAGGWSTTPPTTGTKLRVGTVLEVSASTGAVLIAPALCWPTAGGYSQEIDDVAAGGSFSVNSSGVVHVTTTGSEGRTVPVPQFLGQKLMIVFDVDGGDLTVTVTGGMNQSGHTSAVMADAGDHIVLEAGQVGGALRWRLTSNDGASTS